MIQTSIEHLQPINNQIKKIKKIRDYTYCIDDIIGKGNFSTVYEAFSQKLKSKLAVKIVDLKTLTFKKLEQLLQQQIQIMLTLNHKNILKCYDVLKTSEQCYFFSQLCDKTLANHIKTKGILRQDQLWPYLYDIYQGLVYLQSKNIIHRDLKIANIFLKNGVAKIGDFGFAVHSRLNFTDINIGSPFYMSPQGLRSNIYGEKTDVWAFGIVLYQLLHGTTPWGHLTDQQSLKRHLLIPITQNFFKPGLSKQLKDFIIKCLTIDLNKRPTIKQLENHVYMKQKLDKNISQNNSYISPSSIYYNSLLTSSKSTKIIRLGSFQKQSPNTSTGSSQTNNIQDLQIEKHQKYSLKRCISTDQNKKYFHSQKVIQIKRISHHSPIIRSNNVVKVLFNNINSPRNLIKTT